MKFRDARIQFSVTKKAFAAEILIEAINPLVTEKPEFEIRHKRTSKAIWEELNIWEPDGNLAENDCLNEFSSKTLIGIKPRWREPNL